MDIIIGIAIGVGICLLAATLVFCVWAYHRLRREIEAKFTQLRAETIAAQRVFFDRFETWKSDIETKRVAPLEKIADNSAVPEDEDVSTSTPFWNDREKLTAVKARLEGGNATVDPDKEPDLAGMTDLEAWREIDARLYELNHVDTPSNERGTNQR